MEYPPTTYKPDMEEAWPLNQLDLRKTLFLPDSLSTVQYHKSIVLHNKVLNALVPENHY